MKKLLTKEQLKTHTGSCANCKHDRATKFERLFCLRSTIEVWSKKAKRFIYKSVGVNDDFICPHWESGEVA